MGKLWAVQRSPQNGTVGSPPALLGGVISAANLLRGHKEVCAHLIDGAWGSGTRVHGVVQRRGGWDLT
eukprot:CAMPEP_0185203840 /NCGR_PEP_ID=MMETSP1140-20130426/53740_1 /TAXON_ID=298111 /ORGANISM="Pavlova sp., Strain CCMP459" /LENGTH=67 /DNA_ID=CAMNT_0027771355 /DNA_START=209 /DNA_END=412 /DNA_ORIENTATION=+